jgi:hypothetical protein
VARELAPAGARNGPETCHRGGSDITQASFIATASQPSGSKLPRYNGSLGSLIPAQIATIIHINIHHRRECLPQKNHQVQDQSHPYFNPAPEGQTMLIHLLTCLALTTVTLTLFSRLVLDIGQTEEPKS